VIAMAASDAMLAAKAEELFEELRDTVKALHESEDEHNRDAAWNLTRTIADWAMNIPGAPGDAHAAYLVVLREAVDDDNAEMLLRLLLRIDGVIAVEPIEEGWRQREPEVSVRIATNRVRNAVNEALYEALDHHWSPPRTPKSGG
jgi:hypothetical protein